MIEHYKDINECLMAGCPREAVRECLERARDFAPEKIKGALDYKAEFYAEWFDQELEPGHPVPFAPYYRVRTGELTIWTGIEKSGKTTLLAFVVNWLMSLGERALVSSMETRAVKTLKKYSRQSVGQLIHSKKWHEQIATAEAASKYMAESKARAEASIGWLHGRMWVYDHVGILQWKQLLEDMVWARHRLGITQFVVDNFMRLGIYKDDYPQQAEAVAAFAQMAMDTDSHVHLVVHQNKSEGQGKGGASAARGKRSVSGAFEIIASAHNIVEVVRDHEKGEKVCDLRDQLGVLVGLDEKVAGQREELQEELKALDARADGKFILHAQREGETQNGSTYLYFLWDSQQYCQFPKGHAGHKSRNFVEETREREEKTEKMAIWREP